MGVSGAGDESELLVINTRYGLVAVTVSELIDRRRVAVKNLGPILEGPGHVTGAALLGGGQVLVVLDPNFLGYLGKRRPGLVGHRPRILVVDDSAGVRQLLSATLNGAGFEVEVAAGAREAMMAMANDGFEAMVIDFSMPRSNGVELVRAMRATDVKVPIVMVSGVATQEEASCLGGRRGRLSGQVRSPPRSADRHPASDDRHRRGNGHRLTVELDGPSG